VKQQFNQIAPYLQLMPKVTLISDSLAAVRGRSELLKKILHMHTPREYVFVIETCKLQQQISEHSQPDLACIHNATTGSLDFAKLWVDASLL
jgi:hypothetical protein